LTREIKRERERERDIWWPTYWIKIYTYSHVIPHRIPSKKYKKPDSVSICIYRFQGVYYYHTILLDIEWSEIY